MTTATRATIADLYRVEGKAELINGEVVRMSPTGGEPARRSSDIYSALRAYERQTRRGYAYPDNAGFRVNLSHRGSFSPDAAFHGSAPDLKFVEGAPLFAVEVRSENDYGPPAEHAILDKIADYFAAGTQIVWDVDLLGPNVVRKYLASDPNHPILFRRGEVADVEPALPDWRLPVDDLFS